MATGRQTLSDIEASLADLRRKEADVSAQLTPLTDRIARSRADEAEALRDIARFRLASSGADSVARRLDQASRDARETMAARDAAIATLTQNRTAKSAALADSETKLARLRQELDQVEDRIEALAGPLKQALDADPAHRALAATAETTATMAEAAVKKAEQSEADRTGKGKAYEADPLFMYLWNRQFGTSEYRYRGLTRLLDRWVANLIGFQEARQSYVLLNEIPKRLARHAERVQDEAEAAAIALEQSEDAALARLAGENLAAREDALRAQVAQLDEAASPAREEAAKLDQIAVEFAEGKDPGFIRAIDALSRSIAGDDIRTLYDEARRTPSPEDETYVERLGRARDEIARLEPDAGRLRGELSAIASKRQELEGIARDFRSRGWDNSGHSFDLGDLLTGFILGRISRGGLWGGIEGSHRGGSSTWGGGTTWRPSGRSGGFGGGRIGGGGFRTGGRIGGGGFRTGRRF